MNFGNATITVSIEIEGNPIMAPDEDQTLVASILPADASQEISSWKSSNTSVATVTGAGFVQATAFGNTTITVTANIIRITITAQSVTTDHCHCLLEIFVIAQTI